MPICLKYEKQTFIQFLTEFFLQENGLRCSMETWQTGNFLYGKCAKFSSNSDNTGMNFQKQKKIFSEKINAL